MMHYTVWFDPYLRADRGDDFHRLADALDMEPVGRSPTPKDGEERWSAIYRGNDHLIHVLNTWVIDGWRFLIYRGDKPVTERDTSAWMKKRADARLISHAFH